MKLSKLAHFDFWSTFFYSIKEKQNASKTKMVFCYQNCSDLLWEKNCFSDREKNLKFEGEGQEFAKILRLLEQFIHTVIGQNNFW